MTALICFFLTAMYAYILYWQRRVALSWRALRLLYKNRFALTAEILNVALLTYAADSEVIISLQEALNKYERIITPEETAAADKKLLLSYIKLQKLTEVYPLLYETERYAALKDALVILEEKIAFSRQFYNKEVASYNAKVFSMPQALLSAIINLKRKNTI